MFDFLKKDNIKEIYVNDIDSLIGKIELIDIRETYEYAGGSIISAKNIPMGDLLTNPDHYMTKDKTYYLLCQSGARSSRTAGSLAKQGFDVVNVSGGMGSYAGTKRK